MVVAYLYIINSNPKNHLTMKQITFVLSCLYLFTVFPSFSQISNEGTIQISASTVVYFQDEYTNSSTGIHNNDGDLYLNSNFINNGNTAATSGTTYFISSDFDIQNILGTTGNINFYNLEVNLTSASKKGISVVENFGLVVANNLSLTSGDLRLVGDAQLLQTHAGINANSIGTGKLLRDRQGNSSTYAFNYFSSPVNTGGSFSLLGGLYDGTDASINSFTPQQVLFNSGAPYNGVPSIVDGSNNVTTPLTINKTWLYKYYQPSAWTSIDENSSLLPGIGYAMKGTNTVAPSQNYVFKGDTNNGTYQIPVNTGDMVLLGNPYPSSMDAHKFINDNSSMFNGSIYFWVDGGSTSHYLANYLGGYAIRNLVTGITPSVSSTLISGLGSSSSTLIPTQFIAVSQGFFVEATGTGNITFDNSQRIFKTESSGDSNFYRSTSQNSIIRIGYEDPEGFHRQLALGFMPNSDADENYNPGYDALMFDNRDDEMFFIIENDISKKYVIQGVGAFDEVMEFPLGLNISETGTHTVMLDGVENFDNPVYLKDTYLQIMHNLSEDNINLTVPPGEYLDRFKIVFTNATLDVNTFFKESIEVFYNGNNNLIINNPNTVTLNKIQVVNTLGQTIQELDLKGSNNSLITMPFDVVDGIYFINVNSNSKQESFKILKF